MTFITPVINRLSKAWVSFTHLVKSKLGSANVNSKPENRSDFVGSEVGDWRTASGTKEYVLITIGNSYLCLTVE